MPLPVGTGIVTPPPVDGQPPVPWTEDIGTMRATWTDPTGQTWELSNTEPDAGWFTRPGIGGWGATTYDITTDAQPRGGDSVRFIRSQSGRLTWPLHIYGDNHQEFVGRYRALKRAFLLTVWRQQPGVLRVARPDGSAREIEAYYQEGFGGGGNGASDVEDWFSANPVLTLLCPDGYWRATSPTVVLRKYIGSGTPYLAPYPTISSSQVLGDTVITNPGDVAAWPTWVVTGPAEAITATNNSTGQQWVLTYSIDVGETITITTDRPTLRGPTGQNIASALNWPDAYLWPLLDGDNDVSVNITGAAAGTTLQLTFYPRYEGA